MFMKDFKNIKNLLTGKMVFTFLSNKHPSQAGTQAKGKKNDHFSFHPTTAISPKPRPVRHCTDRLVEAARLAMPCHIFFTIFYGKDKTKRQDGSFCAPQQKCCHHCHAFSNVFLSTRVQHMVGCNKPRCTGTVVCFGIS